MGVRGGRDPDRMHLWATVGTGMESQDPWEATEGGLSRGGIESGSVCLLVSRAPFVPNALLGPLLLTPVRALIASAIRENRATKKVFSIT